MIPNPSKVILPCRRDIALADASNDPGRSGNQFATKLKTTAWRTKSGTIAIQDLPRKLTPAMAYETENRPISTTEIANRAGVWRPRSPMSPTNPKVVKTKNTASRKIAADLRVVVCQRLGLVMKFRVSFPMRMPRATSLGVDCNLTATLNGMNLAAGADSPSRVKMSISYAYRCRSTA